MITKTGKLNPSIETDNEEQKELVQLFNEWYSDTAFLSCWPTANKYWKKMKEYCMEHAELTKRFWLDVYEQFGEVGHFTFMLHELYPKMFQVLNGYIPLNVLEQLWYKKFKGEMNNE